MYVRPKRVFNPAVRKAVWHGGITHLSRSYPNYVAIAYARTHHTKHKQKGCVHKIIVKYIPMPKFKFSMTMFVLSTFRNSPLN